MRWSFHLTPSMRGLTAPAASAAWPEATLAQQENCNSV